MAVTSVNKHVVESTPPPKRAEETHRPPVHENRTPEQVPKPAPTPPKPVINTQGQETGRHLNVTA